MKSSFLLYILFCATSSVSLFGGIDFSSQDSLIRVSPGSSFYNNSSSLVVDGTLVQKDGASLLGTSITFSNGIFERGTLKGVITADVASNGGISFDGVSDLVLNGKTILSSSWSFSGINKINGNGNILDLSPGGQLVLQNGATLYLTDLFLRGMGDTGGKGKIIFFDELGKIILSNTDIKLENNITYTLGSFYVEGPSTIMLQERDLAFNTNATLTVDGVTLWKDPLDTSNYGDIVFGSIATNLDLVDSGTIKTLSSLENIPTELIEQNSNAIVSCCTDQLVDGPITNNLTVKKSRFIQPYDRVFVAGDVTIEGGGAVLYFATHERPAGPQFVIEEGKTLTLKNINLTGLDSNTFDFRKNSTLIIGENVSWELHENMTLTTGNIILQNQTDDNGQDIANLFYVRGMGGKKRFTLSPPPGIRSPMFVLGQNTLALQDIEFTGLEHVSRSLSSDGSLIGAVGLSGQAAVNIEQSTNMAFAVMGLENVFRILEDNLILNGQLDFVGLGEDVVHFDFVLRSPVESLNAATQLADGKVPVINFATNFIYLTSLSGVARIIFDDAVARVNNDADAFVVTNNGFIGANKLLVSGDPIWDASNDETKNRFAVEAQEIEAVKALGKDYKKELPEFGIPIIVDPNHPHRSAEFRSLQTDENLLDVLNGLVRPQNALQIEKAKEEGIDPTLLILKR